MCFSAVSNKTNVKIVLILRKKLFLRKKPRKGVFFLLSAAEYPAFSKGSRRERALLFSAFAEKAGILQHIGNGRGIHNGIHGILDFFIKPEGNAIAGMLAAA